jgi:2-oxoglutarate ferredoxin oxidoreductase subunit alpha
VEAFRLSEKLRTPVIVLADGEIGHIREVLTLPAPDAIDVPERPLARPDETGFGGDMAVPPMPEIGHGLATHITGSTHKPNGLRDVTSQDVHDLLVRRLVSKVVEQREDLTRIEERWTDGAKVVVVSTGAIARPAHGAVAHARSRGLEVGFVRLIGLWPFPTRAIQQACEGATTVLVPELSLGQLNRELERHLCCQIRGYSRIGGILPTIEELLEEIERALEETPS